MIVGRREKKDYPLSLSLDWRIGSTWKTLVKGKKKKKKEKKNLVRKSEVRRESTAHQHWWMECEQLTKRSDRLRSCRCVIKRIISQQTQKKKNFLTPATQFLHNFFVLEIGDGARHEASLNIEDLEPEWTLAWCLLKERLLQRSPTRPCGV